MPLPSMDFIYKLNAMESAARADEPAKAGYAASRSTVLCHVGDLERKLRAAEAEVQQSKRDVEAMRQLLAIHNLGGMTDYTDGPIKRAISAEAELARVREVINTPELDNFLRAVHVEAIHQVERWGTAHDRAKRDSDWFWLVGYLAGKALHSSVAGNNDKALHHCVSTAAALYNWHCAIKGVDVRMCPGKSDLEAVLEDAFGTDVTRLRQQAQGKGGG